MAKKSAPKGKKNLNLNVQNFKFEISVPAATKLVRIDIDGTVLQGEKLLEAIAGSGDGVAKGGMFVPLVDDKVFVVIDAVGEPNIQLSLLSLKFLGKDVFDGPKKFTILDNRRGQLAEDNITLP